MTQDTWKSHVAYLCSVHNVTIIDQSTAYLRHYDRGYVTLMGVRLYDASYMPSERVLIVPRLEWQWTEQDYATCLHELGHANQRMVPTKYLADKLPYETDAWQYAINVSQEWTLVSYVFMRTCLKSHWLTAPIHTRTPQNLQLLDDVIKMGQRRVLAQ